MTAAPDIVVPIPALLEHQQPVARHPARFKLLRHGRRWGKDRLAFNVAWFGHGPRHPTIDRFIWPGIVDGWDVAWLGPDYGQLRSIWQEEIEPRFGGVRGVTLNESQTHSVTIEGAGTLHLRSSENMRTIRGLGKRLIGVIINEAAHLDLAYAWRRIVRPVLMDNQGWALIMSTTNSGSDGGKDEQGNARIPSYFNTLCEEVRVGTRGEEWAEFHGTAEENPKITAQEFRSVVSEYPQGSTSLREEIYAQLLAPGKGLAFPEWRDDLHVIDKFDLPKHWWVGAGFDWGYWQPSVFVAFGVGEEGHTVGLSEGQWVQQDGETIGRGIGDLCLKLPRPPEHIAADSSMWDVPARQGFPNQAEEIQAGINARWKELRRDDAPMLIAVPKGRSSRVMRASLLHKYLKWRADDGGTVIRKPRLRFLRSCHQCIGTIPKLPPDPKKPEDVDTTANDHAYDAATYFLLSRPPLVDAPPPPLPDENVHPGFDKQGRRRKATLETELWDDAPSYQRPAWVSPIHGGMEEVR